MSDKPSRSHHYIPEFYLAGFTRDGLRTSKLWVHDRLQQKRWQTVPKNIACARDFYGVEVEGFAIDAVEKALASFDDKAAVVLREAAQSDAPLTGGLLESVLNYITLQAVRIPRFRVMFENHEAAVTQRLAHLALEAGLVDEELEAMRARGERIPAGVSREDLRAFLERSTVEVPREASIQTMADVATGLLPVLRARTWSLFVADSGVSDLIVTDSPVALVPNADSCTPFFGFGTRATEVLFPLDRQAIVVGLFVGDPVRASIGLGEVGALNAKMVAYSDRFVYSSEEQFHVSG